MSISISVMGETSYIIEECGDGSHPSEAYNGGREGLWRGGMGNDNIIDCTFIINCLGNRGASLK